MPHSTSRVFVRLLDWSDPVPSVPGQLRVRVEYSLLDGARKDGKFTWVGLLSNSSQLRQDIVDSLVAYLNSQSPAPSVLYRARDVMVWGS